MRKIIALCFLVLSLTAICFGQTNQTSSLTIQTYYPAPTGVYSSLKFIPSNTQPNGTALQPGVIFFNNTTDVLAYYNKTYAWVNLVGGGGGPYWEYNGTTKVLRNTNAGKVIIDGAAAWGRNGTLLQIWGQPVLQGNSGNSALHLSRNNDFNKSRSIIFNTTDVTNRSWVLGAVKNSTNPYSALVLGHIDPAYQNKTFHQMTVLHNGNVGFSSDRDTPFYGASARLHILYDHSGIDDYYETVVTNGNGKIGLELASASDNATLGPVINGYSSEGTLASPAAVDDENSLFSMMPGGQYGGGYIKLVGDLEVAVSNLWNATNNPTHLHVYGTNTTNTDWEQRICVMESGEVDFNYNSWYDFKLHVCSGGEACSKWGGIDPAFPSAWTSGSDGRYKKNISGIEDALGKVLRVKGVRYDPVTETNSVAKKGRQFGFIGQDLEKVIPELVDIGSQGYRSVSYDGITPFLVEAIKDQQGQIESLRQEVEALKARKRQGSI